MTGFALVNLAEIMGGYDWRTATTNVWKVERVLLEHPHQRLRTSDVRFKQLRKRYRQYREANGGRKPLYYEGRDKWTEIPREFWLPGKGLHEDTKKFLR